MAEFGLESLSSSQVSRAAALMDAALEAWRTRPLGAFPCLFLDARYERVRIEGVRRENGPQERFLTLLTPRRRHPVGDRHRRGRQAPRAGDLRRAVGSRGPLAGLSRQPRRTRTARRAVHHQRDHAGLAAARKAVFSLPEAHWRRMRTANPIERAIQQELKRRARKVRVFPNEAALERLATAILVEIDEDGSLQTAPTST